MKMVIRTDASLEIGTGHVMRCLTLAGGLSEKGASVIFVCRAHDGHLTDLIEDYGFVVNVLPATAGSDRALCSTDVPTHAAWLGCDWQTDVEQCRTVIADRVDWIIVDHYALDHRWESAMRESCRNIMVIDDLADRFHDCDMLLDQSLGRTAEDYSNFLEEGTRLLLGPEYALLRPEFAQWRDMSLARRQNPELRHILVTMGGVDLDNVTERVLVALAKCRLTNLEQITVVLGSNAPWRGKVSALASKMLVRTTVLSKVDNMAELMTSCDLAIGGGGVTTWERCSLGVPSVLIVMANNQLNNARRMSHRQAAYVIDDLPKLERSLPTFLESYEVSHMMASYTRSGADLVDAGGVAKIITGLFVNHG